MSASISTRFKNSLRLRLLLATVLLVAVSLAIAALAFEAAARRVVVEAVHAHLASRAVEVHDAVARFQRERGLIVRDWAEAPAMQETLDSRDPKFAEDYLKRTIQDQGGRLISAALLDPNGRVVAGVRWAEGEQRRGETIPLHRARKVGSEAVRQALAGEELAVALEPLYLLDPDGTTSPVEGVLFAAAVKDFAADTVGAVVAIAPPSAYVRLLDEIAGQDGDYRPAIADATGRLVLTVSRAEAFALREPLFQAKHQDGALARVEAGSEALLAVRTRTTDSAPGWTAAMVIPEREALGSLRRLRLVLGALFAAVMAAGAVVAIAAMRRAARPLADVSQSMVRVAGGDLSTRLPDTYSDELGLLVRSFNTMVSEVSRSRDELKLTEAMRREMQIAQQIQTAILPESPAVKGFEIAARMKPAEKVGGDLYDVLSFGDASWILVGDVSGHGINSGLVMMMAQAAAYGAIADDPRASPRHVISAVNRVIHENVRRRMHRDDYMTFMAARHLGDGRFVAAGAHQPIFLLRGGGAVEVVDPSGPWMGIVEDVEAGVVEYEFSLAHGETACFVTDGILEAHGPGQSLYGEDRLIQLLARDGRGSAAETLSRVFADVEAFMTSQEDDQTAVVLRRKHD
ncbi:MAG TPA: SpoIIE family protein phosphatase [Anaeromyxobacteraceae bacterium]|nr:SpoIIE family protein phosphatase [Anaeromyxobacteraceae bacterium]